MDSDCCCEELMINLNLLSTWHFDHHVPPSWNQVFRNEHSYFGLRFKVVLGRAILKVQTKIRNVSEHFIKAFNWEPFSFKVLFTLLGILCLLETNCLFKNLCLLQLLPFKTILHSPVFWVLQSEGWYITDICMQTTNKLQFVKISLVTPSMITCLKGEYCNFYWTQVSLGSDLWARLSLT